MSDFVNTVDIVGDDALTNSIIERTITEFKDDLITTLGDGAFQSCAELAEVSLPNLTEAGVGTGAGYVFHGCTSLRKVDVPRLAKVGRNTFSGCSSLTEIELPGLEDAGNYTFQSTPLVSIVLPKAKSVGTACFQSCAAKLIDLHVAESIYGAFEYCRSLTALIIRTPTVCAHTSTWGFPPTVTSGTGYIYVPRALVEEYKAATNWSTVAAQFRALEDYTVDGTTTGELDETKIAA